MLAALLPLRKLLKEAAMDRVLVAGIDSSTQSCKVRVTDAGTGQLIRFGQAPHPSGTTADPEAWWEAFLEASAQAGGLADISALSVGGQQHGMILLDGTGAVIRDAILWNDTRSAPQASELIDMVGMPERGKGILGAAEYGFIGDNDDKHTRGIRRCVKAAGSSPVASLTVTKLAWTAQNEPDNAARTAAVCLPHDWLSWRIAGNGPVPSGHANLEALSTDRSDASGTGYFDAAANAYRYDIIDIVLGRHDIALPRVLGPAQAGAVADPAIAGADVEGGCIIGPGGGDNAMAALGLSMSAGDVSVSLGTSGVAAAVSSSPVYDLSGSVTGFADCTGHWLPLACTINGSRILDAGCAVLGTDYDGLAYLAEGAEPGAGGVTLIPYFDGERTPNRPQARASLHGMTLANTTRENIARAFIEALLCSQRDCLEMVRTLGSSVERLFLIGGGARSAAVRSLGPSILGMDVQLPATDEYVAIGAARQAAWLLSCGKTAEDASEAADASLIPAAQPPEWDIHIDAVLKDTPNECVYQQYRHWRG